jgi:hypothetical protein
LISPFVNVLTLPQSALADRWGHVVFAVGDRIVDAHNMAEYHKSIDDYTVNECVASFN